MTTPPARSNVRILAGNIANLAISQFAARGAVYALFIVLARVFTKAELGLYALALFYGHLAAGFADLGLRSLALREASVGGARAAEEMAGPCVALRCVSGACFGALLWAFMGWMGYPPGTAWLAMIGAAMAWTDQLNQNLKTFFRALEKTRFDRQATLFGRSLYVGLALGLLAAGGLSPETALAAGLLAYLAEALYLADRLYVEAGIRLRARFPAGFLANLFRRTFCFWLIALTLELVRRSPPLALERLFGEEAAGVFAAAHRPFEAGFMVPMVAMAAVFPRIASVAASAGQGGGKLDLEDPASRSAAARAYGAVCFLMAALMAGPALFAALDAPRVVVFLYRERYLDAAPALPWLALWLLCGTLSNLLGNALILAGLERRILWRYFEAALLFFGLTGWLVASSGAEPGPAGAVWKASFCLAASEALAFALLAFEAFREGLLPRPDWRFLARRRALRAAGLFGGSLAAAAAGAWLLERFGGGPTRFSPFSALVWAGAGALQAGCWLGAFVQVRRLVRETRPAGPKR